MGTVLRISDAASLALHTMVLLTGRRERVFSTRSIASRLKVSEAHLSKVLQRLSRAGLTHSVRGPRGGFTATEKCSGTTMLEVFEAIEGPLTPPGCLLSTPVCGGREEDCMFAGLLDEISGELRSHMANTPLAKLTRRLYGTNGNGKP